MGCAKLTLQATLRRELVRSGYLLALAVLMGASRTYHVKRFSQVRLMPTAKCRPLHLHRQHFQYAGSSCLLIHMERIDIPAFSHIPDHWQHCTNCRPNAAREPMAPLEQLAMLALIGALFFQAAAAAGALTMIETAENINYRSPIENVPHMGLDSLQPSG